MNRTTNRLSVTTSFGTWTADLSSPHDLAIPLAFDGAQPNLFDAAVASATPLRSGSFVGDVKQGGSCNCSEYRLTPHCNGTHTECVGHITRQRVSVRDIYTGGLEPALLLSVAPVAAQQADEGSEPPPQDGDRLITAAALRAAWQPWATTEVTALAIRTLPNETSKRARRYATPVPPYLTQQAAQFIVDRGIRHLLLDTPSLDRTHDEGLLTGHRIFWGMPAGSNDVTAARRPEATVTEMIFAPDDLPDGRYLLDLQIAPFDADAAPSRPILYSVIEQSRERILIASGMGD
jgi:kynurenine formamidase